MLGLIACHRLNVPLMFKFLKKNKAEKENSPEIESAGGTADLETPAGNDPSSEPTPSAEPTDPPLEHPGKHPGPQLGEQAPAAAPLGVKLRRSRNGLGDRLKSLFSLRRQVDEDLLEEVETLLLTSDVGAEASLAISDALSSRVKRKQLNDSQAVWEALHSELLEMIGPVEQPLEIDTSKRPFVILVVGVNGVGKTTTIGKLARRFQDEGLTVMLAAGDTFRAAAIEQLQTWGQRNAVPVVAQANGADSASVIFDALESAKAKDIDVLIADTAGRLHTQANLMDELAKIKRVMGKLDDQAPHEVMLVIDGGTGQNALAQAEQFQQAIGVTGLTVTKLDGTAKGGVLFALAKKLGLPIRFIGVGEGVKDLRPFQAEAFVEAIVGDQHD